MDVFFHVKTNVLGVFTFQAEKNNILSKCCEKNPIPILIPGIGFSHLAGRAGLYLEYAGHDHRAIHTVSSVAIIPMILKM